MERKGPAPKPPRNVPASGEFRKAGTLSEPVRRQEPLELDMDEFEEAVHRRVTARPPPGYCGDEPDTARYTYITSLGQLRDLLRLAVASYRDGSTFDVAAFARSITAMEMCDRERGEPGIYYFIEDSLGNQYRLYMNPEREVKSGRVAAERVVVLDFGAQKGLLFPVAFSGDERR